MYSSVGRSIVKHKRLFLHHREGLLYGCIMPVLDVNRLRVLRAVIASGTVQAAANHLGYTPSAISQQLAALQRETGLTLFEKSGRGIAPTPTGLLLAERSNEVMDSLGRLDGLVDDLREGRTGNVTIGTISSVGQWWIPSVAKALTENFPEVLLSVDLNEAPMAAAANYDIDIRTEDPTDPPSQIPGLPLVRTGAGTVPSARPGRSPAGTAHQRRRGRTGRRAMDR